MRRSIVVVALVCAVGCGGSDAPTTPTVTAPPPAILKDISTTLTVGCFLVSGGRLSCSFSGLAQNVGNGCASGVRGVTKSYNSADQLFDSSNWSYTPTLRPNEQFTYNGAGLLVPTPGAWSYETTFAWDNVRCP